MADDEFVTVLDCEKRHRALDNQTTIALEKARETAEQKAEKICQQADAQDGLLRDDIKIVHQRLDGILKLTIATLVSVILTLVTIFAVAFYGKL